jgi:coenzyme F420-0:L-glutamate ligase/coenzyme F420-1:gamma-L-glutamate ligase
MKRSNVEILAVPGIPLVRKDDDLVALIGEGLARGGIVPRSGDVFVLTQKIVSKAEGRMVDLATGRVGPGNCTLSPSQIPYVNLSIHTARVTA